MAIKKDESLSYRLLFLKECLEKNLSTELKSTLADIMTNSKNEEKTAQLLCDIVKNAQSDEEILAQAQEITTK